VSAPHDLRSWSYVAPDGKEAVGDEQELLEKLRKGDLPPTTLVWQKTWLEWLPAARVSELAGAFPKPRAPLSPLQPKRSPTALRPPARPQSPKLPRAPIAFAPNVPASGDKSADPSSFGSLGRARGASVLGPSRVESANTAPPRPPLATLGDEPNEQRATTLRPPGAIPPPPRAVPGPNFDLTPSRVREELEAPTRRQNPPSVAKDALAQATKPSPGSALPSEIRPAVVVADLDATLGSTPFEVTAQDFVDLSPPSATVGSATPTGADTKTAPPIRKRRSAPPAKQSGTLGIVALATGVGLATFFIVKLLIRPRSDVASAPVLTPPPAAPQATTAAPSGCGIVQPAARLSPRMHRPVAPLVTAAADATRASIGFAETETEAVGVSVDLVTLDVARAFREEKATPIRFVVPRALEPQRFIVDRDDGKHPVTRSFDAEPRFGIGTSDKDWVRVTGGSTGVLWRGQATDKTTDPRIASGAAAHVVTFRRAGLSGQVMVGVLAPDGSAKGDLRAIEAPGIRLAGTPDAALSGKSWLVAFAGRATPEEPWRIVLASGRIDGGAPAVRPFTTPPGGAGGSSIAPSVTGLGDGGFVLQWTEGKTAEYQVRVQRLGPDLQPLGEAVLVSPKGANSGQGVVFARAPRALSLFVQTTQGHDELWGTSLECP
jgi:hypothetical protein